MDALVITKMVKLFFFLFSQVLKIVYKSMTRMSIASSIVFDIYILKHFFHCYDDFTSARSYFSIIIFH